MKKLLLGNWLLLIIFILLLSGCQNTDKGEDEQNNSNGISVSIGSPEQILIKDYFKAIGKVTMEGNVSITPAISGEVESVEVQSGDEVVAGDVLYRLVDDSARSNISQTLSGLASSRDNLKLQLERAIETRDKMQKLYEQGALAKAAFQTYDDQVRLLQNQYDSARLMYVEQSSILSDTLASYTIKTPVSGIVGSIEIKPGERATSQTVVEVIAAKSAAVSVGLTYKQLDALEVTNSIALHLATEDAEMPLVIERVDPLVNTSTNLYDVTLIASENTFNLSDGAFAEVRFYDAERSVSALPLSAVKYVGQTAYVFWVDDALSAKQLEVATGSVVGDRIEILDLPSDRTWIINGVDRVQDGISVVPYSE